MNNNEEKALNKKHFVQALTKAFANIGITKGKGVKIGRLLNYTPAYVSTWFSEDRVDSYPNINTLIKISELTGVSLDDLLLNHINTTQDKIHIPVVSNSNVEAFVDSNNREQINEFIVLDKTKTLFAIKLTDDSMTEIGNFQSIPTNSLAVFSNSDTHPESGEIVYASIVTEDKKEFLIRRYIETGGTRYLVPINKMYLRYTGEFTIIGTFQFSIKK